jgi:hypothetical protein
MLNKDHPFEFDQEQKKFPEPQEHHSQKGLNSTEMMISQKSHIQDRS